MFVGGWFVARGVFIMNILLEGFLQGLKVVWSIALVVIPLMIVLEIAQCNGLLQKLNRFLARPFRSIGLNEEGAFPVVVAMVFGLTYGSGVIINHVREGKVTAKDTKVIGTFIALAHALIEDTIIFASLGAPFLLLVLPRFIVAYLMSYVVHKRTPDLALVEGNHFESVD